MTDWLSNLVTGWLSSCNWHTDWLMEWLIIQLIEWATYSTKTLTNIEQLTDSQLTVNWVSDWLTEWLVGQLNYWLCNLVPDWLTEWLIEQVTDWLCNWVSDWLTEWPVEHLTDWLCSWVPDWLTEWLIEQLTEWLTKLSNLPSNWLPDLGTDCGPQSRGQFNKTFTSVIYKCIHCLESVLIMLWTNELLYSIPMNFNFLFSRTEVSDNSN